MKFQAKYTYNIDFLKNKNNSDYWYIAGKLLNSMYSTESNLYLKRKKDIALEVHPQLKDIV